MSARNVACAQERRERPENDSLICSETIVGNEFERHLFKELISAKGYTVMVAGLPRKGKSTALNNFLGMKLPAESGVGSVTRLVKKCNSSQLGVQVCGIDAPGLQASDDINTEKTLKDMNRMIGEGVDNFTLLYCLSANNAYNSDDIAIIKNLTKHFGKRIWKQCILVLTYCDSERSQNYETPAKDEQYKDHLLECARAFEEALEHTCPVRTIFECQATTSKKNEGITQVRVPPDTILAVPAARTREKGRESNILPGFKVGHKVDWVEYGLLEIMRKSGQYSKDDLEKMKDDLGKMKDDLGKMKDDLEKTKDDLEKTKDDLETTKHQNNVLLTIATVVGGGSVAAIGGIIGMAGGPIGVGIGAAVGSGVVALLGGIGKYWSSGRS